MATEEEKTTMETMMLRYGRALHAMQSGVENERQINPRPTDPKHLRVGVNAVMCDHTALVRLLISKGLITEDEYITAIAEEMEREKERYEQRLSNHFGRPVTLE